MKVMDRCMGCKTWGECHWSLMPTLRLCLGCFMARFGHAPGGTA